MARVACGWSKGEACRLRALLSPCPRLPAVLPAVTSAVVPAYLQYNATSSSFPRGMAFGQGASAILGYLVALVLYSRRVSYGQVGLRLSVVEQVWGTCEWFHGEAQPLAVYQPVTERKMPCISRYTVHAMSQSGVMPKTGSQIGGVDTGMLCASGAAAGCSCLTSYVRAGRQGPTLHNTMSLPTLVSKAQYPTRVAL